MGFNYNVKSRYRYILLVCLIGISFFSSANNSGKKAFKANCQACHMMDRFATGPSMVYMRDHYPIEKRDAFLDWAKNPGKKNPDTIQMPPMGHLGDQVLTEIHDYILFVSKHLKEQKPKPKFDWYRAPTKPFPYLKRKYLPYTSPASIAISLSKDLTLAWDTTIGRVRYAYPTYAPFNGEKNLEANREKLLYQETANHFFSFQQNFAVDYLGYDMVGDNPEFIYQIGNVKVREKITIGTNSKSFIRHYQIMGVTSDITLNFTHEKSANIKASKGLLTNSQLKLTPSQAKQFTVEVTL